VTIKALLALLTAVLAWRVATHLTPRTRHMIGVVARLVLHVATMVILLYVLYAAYGNTLGTALVRAAANTIGVMATIRALQTLSPMAGVFHALVPVVQPVWLVASLIALPSVLIETLVRVHSRRRRLQLAKTATTASRAVQVSPEEAAWGDLFNGTPEAVCFGGAEASLLLATVPWDPSDMTETKQPESVFIRELVLSHLAGILSSVVALAGIGLILAGVFT